VDSSRISFGETIAGSAAVALFVFMFIPWYGATATVGNSKITGAHANAWQAFSFIDIILFLVVAITLGLVIARAADAIPSSLPAPPGMIILGAGAIAVVLILFRLLNTPGEDIVGFGVNVAVGRKIGVFLGLIAAVALTYGGWAAAHGRPEVSVRTRDDQRKDDDADGDGDGGDHETWGSPK
jgi:hypothetical protein